MIKKLGGSQGINPNKLNIDVGSLSDKSFTHPKTADASFLKK